jgi:hypothetical protein
VLIYFILPILCNGGGGGDKLCELLGEGKEVLDLHELQKPIPGLWKGFPYWKILSFVLIIRSLSVPSTFWYYCWSHHTFIHPFYSLFILSRGVCTPFIPSLTHISSFWCLGLRKEDEPLKNNHDFVSCRDCWCNPTMI